MSLGGGSFHRPVGTEVQEQGLEAQWHRRLLTKEGKVPLPQRWGAAARGQGQN